MARSLPVLENNRQVYVLSWLHDGLTLYFGDRTKMERQLKTIMRAVDERAESEGIPTKLEPELLDVKELRQSVEAMIAAAESSVSGTANRMAAAA